MSVFFCSPEVSLPQPPLQTGRLFLFYLQEKFSFQIVPQSLSAKVQRFFSVSVFALFCFSYIFTLFELSYS